MKEELDEIIKVENLNPQLTKIFINKSFNNGFIADKGVEFPIILPYLSRFSNDNGITKKKRLSVFKN